MAKDLANEEFMKEFKNLSKADQEKLITKLEKEKKPVPGATEEKPSGAAEGWG